MRILLALPVVTLSVHSPVYVQSSQVGVYYSGTTQEYRHQARSALGAFAVHAPLPWADLDASTSTMLRQAFAADHAVR
jgi:hypothetical protein